MFEATIPKNEHTNVMSSFWSMMMELETQADNTNSALDKHMVAGYFSQWNRIMGDNKEPSWVRREARAAA